MAPRAVRIARSAPLGQRDGHAGRHAVAHGDGGGADTFPGQLAQHEVPGRVGPYRRDQLPRQPQPRRGHRRGSRRSRRRTIQMPSTSFSCWPKDGVTSPPSTSTSGLQSPDHDQIGRPGGLPPRSVTACPAVRPGLPVPAPITQQAGYLSGDRLAPRRDRTAADPTRRGVGRDRRLADGGA